MKLNYLGSVGHRDLVENVLTASFMVLIPELFIQLTRGFSRQSNEEEKKIISTTYILLTVCCCITCLSLNLNINQSFTYYS